MGTVRNRAFRFITTLTVCFAGVAALAPSVVLHRSIARGATARASSFGPELSARLRGVAATFNGKVAFGALDLSNGAAAGFDQDTPVATASIIKLPIMVEAFYQVHEARLRWETPLLLRHNDKVEGAGILQDLSDGLRIALADAVMLMIVESDNTATNLVIGQVGVEPVNARMERLGLHNTRLYRKVYAPQPQPAPPDAQRFGLGKTSVNDMLRLLQMMERSELIDAPACHRMIEILKKQRDIDAFPRYLDRFAPPDHPLVVAHKTGALDALRNDVGIIYTPAGAVALAGFAYDSADTRWTADNAALLVLGRLAETVVEAKMEATQKSGGERR